MPSRVAPHDTVVIIGGGLAGAAAAWALTRRGRAVTLLEQFGPANSSGSSHGSARIVRRAYGDALYTRLTGRAFELWDEVPSPRPLLRLLGALDFGATRDVPTVAAHLEDAGVAHEVMPAQAAAARWPGMRFVGDVLFHAQAGTLDADAAVAALVAAAIAGGADVRHDTAASDLEVHRGRARVRLSTGEDLVAGTVVVAAGGWIGPLLAGVSGAGPSAALPPLTVTQQQVWHFPRRDPAGQAWPSVIHEDATQTIYHLAGGRDGGPGDDRKLGDHLAGPQVAAGVPAEIDPAAETRVIDYVRAWLPGLDPTPRGVTTCLYTHTPSQDFVLDRVGPLVVCSPCSGHGAKFAPLIGEYVADLVDNSGQVPDRFSLAAHRTGLGGAVSL